MEQSEYYKPMMERIIGVGYKRCEEMRESIKKGDSHDCEMITTCMNWWNSLDAFSLMASCLHLDTGELSWISVAVGNNKSIIADYIEKHLGFSPILDVDLDGKARNDKVPKTWCTLEYIRS